MVQHPMIVLGLDPGYSLSALVTLDGNTVVAHCIEANADILTILALMRKKACELVIEQVAHYGMPVGEEVFETVFWSGRFAERWGRPFHRIKRLDVKMHLCKNPRANDPAVRQALLDRFGPGREKALGSKALPGPLYGVHADEWAALAVAVAWSDQTSLAMRANA